MANRPFNQVSYGLSQALIPENPPFILAARAPLNTDFAQPSTIWINKTNNTVYILATVANNVATWVQVAAGGGAGVFSSLTVTPGPISLTGTTAINTAGAAVTTIGTGGTGAVNIGNTTGNTAVTGTLTASAGFIATTGGLTVSAGGASITGATTINTAGGASTTIGTGGTGVVNIGNATGNTSFTGSIQTTSAVTSGGNVILNTANTAFVFQNGIQIISGTGAPGVNAPQGSLYLRTDGSTVNDRAYIATNGTGAWTPITTSA